MSMKRPSIYRYFRHQRTLAMSLIEVDTENMAEIEKFHGQHHHYLARWLLALMAARRRARHLNSAGRWRRLIKSILENTWPWPLNNMQQLRRYSQKY